MGAAAGGRERMMFFSSLQGFSVGIDQLNFADVQLADAGFDFGAITDNHPDHVQRFDKRLGGIVDIGSCAALGPFLRMFDHSRRGNEIPSCSGSEWRLSLRLCNAFLPFSRVLSVIL